MKNEQFGGECREPQTTSRRRYTGKCRPRCREDELDDKDKKRTGKLPDEWIRRWSRFQEKQKMPTKAEEKVQASIARYMAHAKREIELKDKTWNACDEAQAMFKVQPPRWYVKVQW